MKISIYESKISAKIEKTGDIYRMKVILWMFLSGSDHEEKDFMVEFTEEHDIGPYGLTGILPQHSKMFLDTSSTFAAIETARKYLEVQAKAHHAAASELSKRLEGERNLVSTYLEDFYPDNTKENG